MLSAPSSRPVLTFHWMGRPRSWMEHWFSAEKRGLFCGNKKHSRLPTYVIKNSGQRSHFTCGLSAVSLTVLDLLSSSRTSSLHSSCFVKEEAPSQIGHLLNGGEEMKEIVLNYFLFFVFLRLSRGERRWKMSGWLILLDAQSKTRGDSA